MKRLVLAVVVATAVVSGVCAADVTEIIRRAEQPFTVERVYSVSTMTTYDGDRVDRTMTVESYSLYTDDTSRSLMIYTDPVRMRGTAYLTIGNDLWVRFGSTGRVRKLSSSAKSGSAGGSDFSYEDLGEGSGGISASYSSRLLRDSAERNDEQCYEVELTPLPEKDSSYDRLVAYITHDTYRYVAIDYYESGAHTKTLTIGDYRRSGGIDYPYFLSMESLTKGTRTELATTEVEIGSQAVRESMFTVQYLERLR